MAKFKKNDSNFMTKIATFIVDKRNLFFLIFIASSIFSIFSMNWVNVENDITTYLPNSTETRLGLTVMDKEFTTYGTANVMINNVSYERALKLKKEIEKIEGVSSVEFKNNDEHYSKASALFSVTFDGKTDDDISKDAMKEIRTKLSNYDIYVSTEVGNSSSDSLKGDMRIILMVAVVIILLVLTFTSKSYAEIPVLLITFGAAALLNKGTNFMFSKLSFISNSVAIVLQLALAIDYAIILCHRYTEERETKPQREAIITALSKAIPEISSSSLTTISGLAALIIMQFKIGQDLSFVLIKAIFLSLFSVFTLMPGLIMIFGKYMEKTTHKNFVPKINFIGKFDLRTKKSVPLIFVGLMIIGFFISQNCPYCYGQKGLPTIKKSANQIAEEKITATFKQPNLLAIVVPAGNYSKESALLSDLEQYKEVDHTLGLCNTKALGENTLTDSITPREFGELTEVDYEAAKVLYAAYAANSKDYGKIVNNLDSYSVPIINMLEFLHDEIRKGYVNLDDETVDKINDAYSDIQDGKKQLQSKKYTRMLVYLNLDEEGEETFAFIDTMHKVISKYYDTDTYIVGNSTSNYDLAKSFSRDNIMISVLSALFVVIILFFTFQSAALPILLIAVIQGSIWINFSFPVIMHERLFFLGYLIVSSIQMGANIDYAIVISSRFSALKKEMDTDEAMIETLNQAFPTIITSGTILASAGILIACISTNGIIASIGECLGRGTIISMVLVMCVLPQIILLGNSIIDRTAFSIKPPEVVKKGSGIIFVNGRVVGQINGVVDADVHGVIHGDLNAAVKSQNIEVEQNDEEAKEDLSDEENN